MKGTWWLRGTRPTPRQAGLLAVPPVAVFLWLQALRRLGPASVVLAPVGFVALDLFGGSRRAPVPERLVAAAAMATYTSAWWVGGRRAAGEVLGVEHEHGVEV